MPKVFRTSTNVRVIRDMRYKRRMEFKDIAAELDVSEKTVRRAYYEGARKVRKGA